MTEPLSTVCDHCDAKLKLKNADLEGKKIKCPKCGEAFVVVAAASAAPVKKAVKKKPADDDDFMNVDADDYDCPVDDDEDVDDDDAPRSRRRNGARGK